jgi:MoaA/NifB/PqqE/SkfB family radical SAM enzyme
MLQNADYYPYVLEAVSRNNVLPLTSRCNLGCVFCSHRQNPPEVKTFRIPPIPVETVLELAQFLDPAKKVIIGESATRLNEGEPFTHPDFLHILASLRAMFPQTPLAVTTNGTLLDEETIRTLAALQPLELTVSLNSATMQGRQILLRDTSPQRALEATRLLVRYRVPFHGSLLAMPHLTGWDDMAETVRFLAHARAQTIRVFLPGYTDRAPDELRFPLSLWGEVLDWARAQSENLRIPVIPEPALCHNLTAEIYGVIRKTPADNAGLPAGWVIRRVDDTAVFSRVDAFERTRRAQNPKLEIACGMESKKITLKKKRRESPGFVVHYDFDPQRFADIRTEIKRCHARRPLLLASEFAYPLLRQMAPALGLPDDAVIPVPSLFFGGSIKAAGLLTMNDFLAAAKATTDSSRDLVLIPREALDARDRDLTGNDTGWLAAQLGIKVRAV